MWYKFYLAGGGQYGKYFSEETEDEELKENQFLAQWSKSRQYGLTDQERNWIQNKK